MFFSQRKDLVSYCFILQRFGQCSALSGSVYLTKLFITGYECCY